MPVLLVLHGQDNKNAGDNGYDCDGYGDVGDCGEDIYEGYYDAAIATTETTTT